MFCCCGRRRGRAARCWPHGRRGCSLRRCVLSDERRWHSPRHPGRGCCGGRRERAARCWPHSPRHPERGCCGGRRRRVAQCGLTASAAAACVGVCGLQSEDGRRGCGLHRRVWARERRRHAQQHHERGCCGGRRKRAARCWAHGRRGCCLRRCVRAAEWRRHSPLHPPMG